MGPKFWSPLMLGIASCAFSVFWGTQRGWDMTAGIATVVTVGSLTIAYIAAKSEHADKLRGGAGGEASAFGRDSDALGGAGGKGITGLGGKGGDALAKGKGSRAKGGRGGDA